MKRHLGSILHRTAVQLLAASDALDGRRTGVLSGAVIYGRVESTDLHTEVRNCFIIPTSSNS